MTLNDLRYWVSLLLILFVCSTGITGLIQSKPPLGYILRWLDTVNAGFKRCLRCLNVARLY